MSSGWIQIRGSDAPADDQEQQESGWVTVSREKPQQNETPRQQEFATVGNGTREYSAATGEVTHTPSEQADKASIIQCVHGTGILGTANELDLKPSTIVVCDGMGMQLSTAERLGYVAKDASGRYVEVAEAERIAAEQRAQKQANTDAIEPEPIEGEAAIFEMVKDVPPELLGAAVIPHVIEVARTGKTSLTYEKFASITQTTPEQAQAFMDAAMPKFIEQAYAAVAKYGVEPEPFFNWCRQNHTEAFVQAMVNQFAARTTRGYVPLVAQYMAHVPPSAESLKALGYETMIDPNTKEQLVKVDGMWTTIKAATRDGRF